MKRLAVAFAAVVLLAAASPANAETKTIANVQIDVPAGWKMGGNEKLTTLQDAKDEVGFLLIVLDAADLKKAAANLDAELAKIATDIKWEAKPKQVKLNGMDAVVRKGSAKIKGKDAGIMVLIVKTPSGKMLLVFGGVDAAKFKDHKKEIDGFINSIKPAK